MALQGTGVRLAASGREGQGPMAGRITSGGPQRPCTHSSRADARKRTEVLSTRYRCSQGTQEAPGPALSRWRTHTLPASYMVSRVRKGPQVLEGFTLEEEVSWNPLGNGPSTRSLPASEEGSLHSPGS